MADLILSPPRQRSLIVPLGIAVIVLVAAFGLYAHLVPHHKPEVAITATNSWQSHTVFKTETILVGRDKAEDDLYVMTTVRISNPLDVPLFLKDMNATLTPAEGEPLSSSATQKNDLPSLYVAFPALKKFEAAPLLRETAIQPGQTAEGLVVLHFPTTKDVWKHRTAATLTVDFYHQKSETITIPGEQETSK